MYVGLKVINPYLKCLLEYHMVLLYLVVKCLVPPYLKNWRLKLSDHKNSETIQECKWIIVPQNSSLFYVGNLMATVREKLIGAQFLVYEVIWKVSFSETNLDSTFDWIQLLEGMIFAEIKSLDSASY